MAKLKISESLEGKLVRFKTRDGLFLHGFLSGRNGKRAVIHLHGLGGNFYRSGLTWALAKRYSDIGYDLFSINARGHDTVARVGTVGGKRTTIGTAYEPFEQCVYDIAAAINTVQGCGYRRIVLQGHSTGCQKITYYQSKKRDKRVLGLVLLAPSDDLNLARKGLGKNYGKAVFIAKRLIRKKHGDEFMPSWAGQGLVSANRFASFAIKGNAEADIFDYETGSFKLLKRIKVPIFATFGSAEEHKTDVPPAKALAMIKEKAIASQKVDTALIKGADHGFSGKEKELADAVARWIEEIYPRSGSHRL